MGQRFTHQKKKKNSNLPMKKHFDVMNNGISP